MTDQSPPPKSRESRSGRLRRVRRILRAVVLCVGTVCLLFAVGLWLVTRSWFIIAQITPELEQKLGGKILIEKASYEGAGRFIFHDCVLVAPGLPDGAEEIVRINEIDVIVDLEKLLRGKLQLDDVRLLQAHFRISENAHDTSVFNFMNLEPDWSAEEEWKLPLPPRVRIIDAQIEYGTHDEDGYQVLGGRYVGGELDPIPDAEGWYDFSLIETNGMNGTLPGGIHIYGKWNAKTHEHEGLLNGIKLDKRTFDMCPQVARVWWESMDLEGTVARLTMNWRPGEPFVVEMVVEDVALTLPIETDELWSQYRNGAVEPTRGRPRMQVNSGTIRVEPNRLVLNELVGEFVSSESREAVVGVPYQVSIAVESLPELDWDRKDEWMTQVLELAPFEMDFAMKAFRVSGDQEIPTAVELPTVVARALEKFEMTSWTLSTRVKLTRDAPYRDEMGVFRASRVETDGTAYVRDGAGAFERFPYRLEDIEAYLLFNTDLITVHSLDGSGSNGAPVSIKGTIGRPAAEGSVDLQITAEGAPLDERFYAAIQESEQRAYDTILHRPSYDALVAAGVLRDPGVPVESDLNAPEFALGGTVDLDLYVKRKDGAGQLFAIGGTINVHETGILYERFPYPIRIERGRLIWEGSSVTVDDTGGGLVASTLGGGTGRFTGGMSWSIVDGVRRLAPDFRLTIDDDPMSEALRAAIPPTRVERAQGVDEGWPGAVRSRVARLLEAAGIDGTFDYTGEITANDAGGIAYDFDVRLRDGVATPKPDVEEVLGGAELLWSAGLDLTDVNGHLKVTNEEIKLLEFTGMHDEAHLSASGLIDLRPEVVDTRIKVEVENLALGKYVVDLARMDGIERAVSLWDEYRPAGRFDAQLEYRSGADGPDPTRLEVQLRQLHVMLDDQPVLVECNGGTLTIAGGALEIEDLVLDIRGHDRYDGRITLSGVYGVGEEQPALRLEGKWEGGQLGSPVVGEVLRMLGAETGVAENYSKHEPTGDFDAEFLFVSGTDDSPRSYEFSLKPHAISLLVKETPIYAELDGEGEISFVPGSIRLRGLRGTHAGGTFALDGLITSDETIAADLQLTYEGSLLSHQFQAFMPAGLMSALEAVGLQEGEPSWLPGARIRMEQLAPGDPPSEWRSSFAGDVHVRSASLRAGVDVTEVNGIVQVDGSREPGAPPMLYVHGMFDSMEVLGHRIERVETPILLSPGGDSIQIPALRGEMGGGAVHAQVEAGLGDRLDYSVAFEIVGSSLDEFLDGLRDAEADETVAVPVESSEVDDGQGPSGHLFATLRLAGLRGDVQSRSGRGAIRLMGGRVVDVPLVMQIVQILQLTVPFTGSIDYADAVFFVDGDRMALERILLESTFGSNATLQLIGEGNLDLDTFEINTRFHTRSGIMLIRELAGALGDALYAIEVTGPIGDPSARVIPLPEQQGAPTSSPPLGRAAAITLGQVQ